MKDFFYIFVIVNILLTGNQLHRMEQTLDHIQCQQDGFTYCHKMK